MKDLTALQTIAYIATHPQRAKVQIFSTVYTRMAAISQLARLAELHAHIKWNIREEKNKVILY